MSFALDVKLWCDRAAEGMRRVRAEALLDIGSGIIADTPIKTGLARGNWQASVDAPKLGPIERRTSISALEELTRTVAEMKGDETFYLANDVPYATRLEFGHSGQAPNGMVRKNVQRWQAEVDAAAAKERSR